MVRTAYCIPNYLQYDPNTTLYKHFAQNIYFFKVYKPHILKKIGEANKYKK